MNERILVRTVRVLIATMCLMLALFVQMGLEASNLRAANEAANESAASESEQPAAAATSLLQAIANENTVWTWALYTRCICWSVCSNKKLHFQVGLYCTPSYDIRYSWPNLLITCTVLELRTLQIILPLYEFVQYFTYSKQFSYDCISHNFVLLHQPACICIVQELETLCILRVCWSLLMSY